MQEEERANVRRLIELMNDQIANNFSPKNNAELSALENWFDSVIDKFMQAPILIEGSRKKTDEAAALNDRRLLLINLDHSAVGLDDKQKTELNRLQDWAEQSAKKVISAGSLPVFENEEEKDMNEQRVVLDRQLSSQKLDSRQQQELRWLNKWADIVEETYENRGKAKSR